MGNSGSVELAVAGGGGSAHDLTPLVRRLANLDRDSQVPASPDYVPGQFFSEFFSASIRQ
jgi:hypothetical protein